MTKQNKLILGYYLISVVVYTISYFMGYKYGNTLIRTKNPY